MNPLLLALFRSGYLYIEMETDPHRIVEAENVQAYVRRAGRTLMIVAERARTTADLNDFAIQIARLEAGIDPGTIDRSSDDYRFGAAAALSAAQNAKTEMLIHPAVAERLQTPTNSRAFVGVLSGMSLGEINKRPDMSEAHTFVAIDFLHHSGLIEYERSDDEVNWRTTGFGEQAFLRMLPDFAKSVPMDELLAGIEAMLERQKT